MKLAVITLAALALLPTASPTRAAIITVGDFILEPAPNQQIPIYVIPEPGDLPAAGVSMNVQIADGGPAVGGSVIGPAIQYVQLAKDLDDPLYAVFGTDAFGRTIFDAVPNHGHFGAGPVPGDSHPQVYVVNTARRNRGDDVPANGLLAIITLDASGLDWRQDGPWDLRIGHTLNGPTKLDDNTPEVNPIPLTIIDGTIMCPEPTTLALLAVAAVASLTYGWRRRQR